MSAFRVKAAVPAVLLFAICAGLSFCDEPLSSTRQAVPTEPSQADRPLKLQKQLFKGKVVLISEALKQRGVKFHADELKNQVALETEKNELIPILPDWRGRAFYQDDRLRNREVELIGFRREGVPYLNVLSIYTFSEKGARQYTDYWCDICSIPMYEIKPCDCCQQDIRLRFQLQDLPPNLDAVEPVKRGSSK